MARYHKSERITKHDRMMDRENLMDRKESRMAGTREQRHETRRMSEMRDAGMLDDDYSATANMPPESFMKEYPKSNYYTNGHLNDTISGIDRQQSEDATLKTARPHKF